MNFGMNRGLLLDLDGVVCDSLPALRQAYRGFLAGLGAEPSDAEFDALNGPPLAEVVRRLAGAHGLAADPEALLADYRARVAEAHAAAGPAAGALEVLREAQDIGWRIAVVTSAPEASAAAWIGRSGLDPYVEILVHGEAVARGKPDPEPYLTAAARLGCSPGACLAVEDSEPGARAALAAGVPTYFLGPEPPAALAGDRLLIGALARFADLGAALR